MVILTKEVAVLEQKAEFYVKIVSPKDLVNATEFLSQVNKVLDTVVEEKEKVTKPLNEALKAERARFKPMEEKLSAVVKEVRDAMSTYQTRLKQMALDEAERIAARVKPGTGNLSVETGMERMDAIEKPQGVVSTTSGAVQFRTVKKFEVVDLRSLPVAFLLPNEVAIRIAMKEGKELEGVRYYEEEVAYNTR